MKKKVLVAGIGVILAAGGAFAAAGVVKPQAPETDWRSKRGTPEYYVSDEQQLELPDLNVNVKGSNGERYLCVGVGVQYKLGAELMNPKGAKGKAAPDFKAPFDKAKLEVRDRLTLLLSNKTVSDLEGREKQNALKQEMLEEIEAAVFPDQLGCVTRVYISKILFQ
jgi:flagellar basal body-associated protein FliL